MSEVREALEHAERGGLKGGVEVSRHQVHFDRTRIQNLDGNKDRGCDGGEDEPEIGIKGWGEVTNTGGC